MADAIFDQRVEPSRTALQELLSIRSGLWLLLARRIEELGGRGAWAWGGAKYGWELKFRRGARPFATLTPKPNGFVILIVLGRAEVAAVDPAALGEGVRSTFEGARQLPDGMWLFHSVESERDVADAVALLELKLPPTVRARLAASRRG
ncbi:MAG: DUF3788 family protein [Candidatus Limnocylindrales bacterium]|jgi:hypothetical protein